jgi:hypothetical protein
MGELRGEVQSPFAAERRSSRIFIRIPVQVSGRNVHGARFREMGETVVVSAHGALLYLNETVQTGTVLTLHNPATQEEQECRVVYLGDTGVRGQRIGVEFLAPAPRFWCVEFPPEDWALPPSSTSRPN